MRLGPDGKIYLPASYGGDTSTTIGYFYPPNDSPSNYSGPPFQAWLGCIQNPNTAGAGCNLNRHAVALAPHSSGSEALGGIFVKPVQADSAFLRHDTVVCNPVGGTFLLQGPAGSFNYLWDDGSTASSRMVSSSGTYYVRNGNYCRYSVDTYVVDLIQMNAVIQQNGNTLSTTVAYDTYQWYRNSDEINGATGSNYVITQNGVYKVVVTKGNCKDTSADFSANLSGIGDVPPLGQQISIYPNPAGNVVYIQSPVKVNAAIATLTGKVIKVLDNAVAIPLNDIAAGIYFLKLFDGQGRLLKVEKLAKISQ